MQHRIRLDVKKFLSCVFPILGTDLAIEIRCLAGRGLGPRPFLTSVDDALSFTSRYAQSYDVYFGVGARARRPEGTWRGTKSDVAYVAALWADVDSATYSAPPGFPEPSAIVSSGRGKHLYWFLEQALSPQTDESLVRFESTNRGIARALSADNAWSVDHVLRVPGTFNFKPGGPYPVDLINFSPERRYRLDDFAAWTVSQTESPQRPSPIAEARSRPRGFESSHPKPLSMEDMRWLSGEHVLYRPAHGPTFEVLGPRRYRFDFGQVDRSRTLFAVACAQARSGMEPPAIAASLAVVDEERGYRKYSSRPYEYLRIAESAYREAHS